MKKIGRIIFVIIGTIIGAGFASGKEIYLFFFRHQKHGLYGLILASCFIGSIIYMIFKLVDKGNINNYSDFLKNICGYGKRINNILFYSIQFIIRIFLLISFYIMIAGFGAYFEQELGINKIIGTGIICILCYYSFKKKTKGLIKINTIFVPILILLILYFGIKNPYNYENATYNITNIKNNWITNSIIYSSYNSIILIPILITLKNNKITKKENILISILCTILLFVLGKTIFFLLFNLNNIQNLEIPTIVAVSKCNFIYRYIFGIVLLISIFTSCISCGYAYLEDFEKEKYEKRNKIICLSSIFISQIGFSKLVSMLYPVFGILGILQIVLIIKAYINYNYN